MFSFILEKVLLKLPQLEDFSLNSPISHLGSIFDYESFIKLKRITAPSNDFINLQNTSLEYAKIRTDNKSSVEIEKKMLQKIILIKTLKDIDFGISYINNKDILTIPGTNNSITKATIYWYNTKDECIINNLIKKFPNLKGLTLHTIQNTNNKTKIEIT